MHSPFFLANVRALLRDHDTRSIRAFAPELGIAEQPATEGAAAVLAGYLHAQKRPYGKHNWRVEQGFEMCWPSRIELEAEAAAGTITAVRCYVRGLVRSRLMSF